MTREEALLKLNDYVMEGVANDIYWAEQSYALIAQVGEYAEQIKAKGFGFSFGALQTIVSERYMLSITKMFEKEKNKYPMRTIPSILKLLEKHADLWLIFQPDKLYKLDNFPKRSVYPKDLTFDVVEYFRASLPDPKRLEDCQLSSSLNTFFHTRDKKLAHNEAINSPSNMNPTWGEGNALLSYAKQFVRTISSVYLNSDFDDGPYLTPEPGCTAIEFKSLLRDAGIIEEDRKL